MMESTKTEIEAKIAGLKSMAKTADKAAAVYHDPTVTKRVSDAVRKLAEAEAFVLTTVRDNIPLLFDLDSLRIDNLTMCSYTHRQGELCHTGIGKLLNITYLYKPTNSSPEPFPGNAGGLYVRAIETEVDVRNVWAHTSDTEHKSYHICTAHRLKYSQDELLALEGDATFWSRISDQAAMTELYADVLLGALSEALDVRTNIYKAKADKLQRDKEALK